MKSAVIVFPGSNCDFDMYHALQQMGHDVEFVWHGNSILDGYELVVLPGGFSYGDYLRAGAIARFSPIMQEVICYAKKGRPLLGVCNGFQILTEAGILPGALLRNKNLRFLCRHVYIRTEHNNSIFSSRMATGSVLKIPIAHGEGNYFVDPATLEELTEHRQIVFRYCSMDGEISEEFNPNGSVANIAGILNKEGNVLGMMPHPERAVDRLLGSEDGKLIFESLIH